MPRHTIAGIDPGATVGVAILDLSGKRIALRSTAGGMADAVRIIESFGTPSLIATDVTPPPETVQKIASYFSCRLFCPKQNVREEEKRAIARGSMVQNNHERDAYSACVLAYRHYANKLRQIDALPEMTEEEKGRIKHLLLRGYHLKDAFASLEEQEEEEERQAGKKLHPPPTAHVLSVEELRLRVSSLARENSNLRLLAEKLEAEKAQLSARLTMLQNEMRRSILQDSELRRLKWQLQQSLDRFRPKRKGHERESKTGQEKTGYPHQKQQPPIQKSPVSPRKQEKKDSLNNLGGTDIDLEKLVAEYRKKR